LPKAYQITDPFTQMILNKLTTSKSLNSIPPTLTYETFHSALRHWNEKTSTSPSGRHLGHYKCLLADILDEEDSTNKTTQDSDKFESKATSILKVYWNLLQAVTNLFISLTRWQVSHTSMIQKTPGISRIDRLRVIHIYEADYNLFFKIFWGRKLVYSSDDNNLLNEGQYGSRPGKRCIDQVIKKSDGLSICSAYKNCNGYNG
jgi:hypothetical protein